MATETRSKLIDTAERLFGQNGLDAVSLREIGRAAGQRNNSVTQYHFGTKEILLRSILAERLVPVNARMTELLVRALDAPGDRVRAAAEAKVRALTERLDDERYRFFFPFLAQVLTSPSWARVHHDNADLSQPWEAVAEAMIAASGLPHDDGLRRTGLATLLIVVALAAASAQGTSESTEETIALLTDAATGVLVYHGT
jgi:AcrR family transcriptional regulator